MREVHIVGAQTFSPQTVWWSLIFTKGFLLVSERVFSISVYSKTVERPNFSIKHRPPSTFIKENNLILVGLCYPSVDDGCLINNIYHAVQLTLLLSRELQIKAADRPCVLASVCQRFGRRVLKDSFFFLEALNSADKYRRWYRAGVKPALLVWHKFDDYGERKIEIKI